MRIVPSTYSARVFWKLKPASVSNYITQVRILIRQNRRWLLERIIFQTTQFDITSLIPNTRYTVRIQTLDGSSQTNVGAFDKVFWTKKLKIKIDQYYSQCYVYDIFDTYGFIFVFFLGGYFSWFGSDLIESEKLQLYASKHEIKCR